MFALDSFEPGKSLVQQLAAFAMHLIPTYILTAVLVVAWKWELIGGIIIALIGVMFTPFVFAMNYRMNHSILMSASVILLITFPFIVVGLLFMLSYQVKKRFNGE